MQETSTDLPDSSPLYDKFSATFPFSLDSFQKIACQSVEAGNDVLVAAPTGAGKTIVGEFAVYLAFKKRTKAFYTTPIKALSNQKYLELCARYGKTQVGLLTGDTNINSDAPIIVMTTEVLRNMIYAESATLEDLQYVVMDEVHYLADRNRGAVWEEVIIHLPHQVHMISLSATVSNAEEFGQWLDTVRGNTQVIVSEHRPVPLWQHVLAQGKIYDLYQDVSFDQLANAKNKKQYKVNPQLVKLHREMMHRGRQSHRDRRRGRRNFTPRTSRVEVLRQLKKKNLLPAIYFIFSRNGCDAAVSQIVASGLNFTNRRQREVIETALDEATVGLQEEDLHILGFASFKQGLLSGVAAHHAGLLPSFKELVEKLFSLGLIKVVFATETLALGVNMPARTVVLEKLVKFNGIGHVDISPGEYTQLTGRAGRRGIDVEGHAVVVWQAETDPQALARLASTRSYPLISSFKPSYNMAVNLIEHEGKEQAQQILETSFAQFQADKSVVGLARKVQEQEKLYQRYRKNVNCTFGDMDQYFELYQELAALYKRNRKLKNFVENDAKPPKLSRRENGEFNRAKILFSKLEHHPCHQCPDLKKHLRWSQRAKKVNKDLLQLKKQIRGKTNSISRTFDRVCLVLKEVGYLEQKDGIFSVTAAGEKLKGIYGENDLLTAACLDQGYFKELNPAALVAIVSTLVFEAKKQQQIFNVQMPSEKVADCFQKVMRLWSRFDDIEERYHLEQLRMPDIGFMWPSYLWARGAGLEEALENTELNGGDFVRWIKQVIDLLDQIAKVTDDHLLRKNAINGIELIRRGIVVYEPEEEEIEDESENTVL
ncbi:MAG: DEAD/DEAH box helicase [Micrococcaceae bacterium]